MPHQPPHLIEDRNANGFSPEPEHGALITGLLEAVASDAVPAERPRSLRRADPAVVGDTCLVSLLDGRFLEPIAVSDPLPRP